MPFTLRNLKEDPEDVGSNFDGAPDLEFRMATQALALEQSGLSYQSVPPTKRPPAGATPLGMRSVPRRRRARFPTTAPGRTKPPAAAGAQLRRPAGSGAL